MKNRYLKAFLSASLSILPMIAIILILHFTGLTPIGLNNVILISISAAVLIIGMALFQIGAEGGLSKVGEYMGSSLSKQSSLFIVILFAFALGMLITCAEPSILIISQQVTLIPHNPLLNMVLLIGGIAVGVGVFVVLGILRIIFHRSLKLWYIIFYFICFMLMILISLDETKRQLIPFIFDSGGVTTGSATVPFILALGAGVATVRGGKNAKNDSFGLVGMASIGPILTMTILMLIKSDMPPYDASFVHDAPIIDRFVNALLPIHGGMGTLVEVTIALTPILLIFFIYELIYIKLPKEKLLKLLIGFGFSYVGLTLFLTAANAAMTSVGRVVGEGLGQYDNWVIILIAFAIGLVTIVCEPAVHVLTRQMEVISDGHINKMTVLLTLSLGVGVAIALAVIRTLFNFSIVYYMVPGYLLCILLMFVCPDIYVAMAFDSGGTASGPMATSFVLPMVIGITTTKFAENANYYEQSFGVVALIALTPILAIQILGVVQNMQMGRARFVMRKNIITEDDAQIIHFN